MSSGSRKKTDSTRSLASHPDDPDVVQMLQVRDDNVMAFQWLVEKYQGRVQAVLRMLLTDPNDIEDVTQNVFLKVYRARKNYEPTAKFSTWLFTIARRAAISSLRGQSRRHESSITPSPDSSGTYPIESLAKDASGMMPTRRAERSELASVVRNAIRALGVRQRTALVLSRYEGMSYQAIADVMETNVATIKSLLARARIELKSLLAPYVQAGASPGFTVGEKTTGSISIIVPKTRTTSPAKKSTS